MLILIDKIQLLQIYLGLVLIVDDLYNSCKSQPLMKIILKMRGDERRLR